MKLLNPQGAFIGRNSDVGEAVLKNNGYTVVRLPGDVVLARAPQKLRSYRGRTVILVGMPEHEDQMMGC